MTIASIVTPNINAPNNHDCVDLSEKTSNDKSY